MAASLALLTRLGDDSLHGVAVVIDWSLRLKHDAVRNAASAVTTDRGNARARAEAAAAFDTYAMPARELSLRRA